LKANYKTGEILQPNGVNSTPAILNFSGPPFNILRLRRRRRQRVIFCTSPYAMSDNTLTLERQRRRMALQPRPQINSAYRISSAT
jgi:hypothetical protein